MAENHDIELTPEDMAVLKALRAKQARKAADDATWNGAGDVAGQKDAAWLADASQEEVADALRLGQLASLLRGGTEG